MPHWLSRSGAGGKPLQSGYSRAMSSFDVAGSVALGVGLAATTGFRVFLPNLPPAVKWATAIIAGGGVAGITQGMTALLRAKSTVMTVGVRNSALATLELVGALLLALLALSAPFVAIALIVAFCIFAVRLARRALRVGHQRGSNDN